MWRVAGSWWVLATLPVAAVASHPEVLGEEQRLAGASARSSTTRVSTNSPISRPEQHRAVVDNGNVTDNQATPATTRGQRRRQEIIEAAAKILREHGPQAVSHRSVAKQVGCSLSAMTYYFSGLDDLLGEAGRVNIARWASRAEQVAETAEQESVPATLDEAIAVILRATLPSDEELLGHYLELVAAGQSEPVRVAYRTGRDRLNAAVGRVLRRVQLPWSAEMTITVVDGASVTALSEGRDVRETAAALLRQLAEETVPSVREAGGTGPFG